ncbi:MAG: sulfurtransferase [bacterium]|nr:sulfurtransferase [bacterium]
MIHSPRGICLIDGGNEMSYRCFYRAFVVLIITSTLFTAQGRSESPSDEVVDSLVTTEWLSRHLDDQDLVVLDCTVFIELDEQGRMRPVNGRANYEKGHIPSAGFADLLGELSDVDGPRRYALPTPENLCTAMGTLGVGDNARVVLYDGSNSAWASRVWWMLRWIGFDRAAVLDGGLRAWTAEGRPLSTEPADEPSRKISPLLRPALVADRDEVFASISDDNVSLIDAMPGPHFQGKMVLYDRPGHIPGAINIPVTDLLDESGRFRPHDELAALCGDDHESRAIIYCGGGIAASANAFVITRLGFTNVAVYMASLQEWAADPANPLVVEKE